jgi:hypothetical protein
VARNLVTAICGLSLSLGGCVTVSHSIAERETYWRQVLESEAPVGALRDEVLLMFRQHDLTAEEGTYRVLSEGGVEASNCRLAERALSAIERSAVRGFYLSWDIEITICLDESGRVESHYVGSWNAGI